jgi:Uma2 family endonuclease
MLPWLTIPDATLMNIRHEPALNLRSAELQPGMAVPEDVYLDWIETQEGKFEYDRGTIGMMVKVTRNHSLLVSRFLYALTRELDGRPAEVHVEAFGVRTADSVRFPDVLVQEPEPDGRALESKAPLVIVEVLSPSSLYADHVVKRDEYLNLPTLQAYIVADANAPKLTLWERGPNGDFPYAPAEIEGPGAELRLVRLGVAISLTELYHGIR